MTMIQKIEMTKDDAAGLERLYRQAEADGDIAAFKDGIGHCLEEHQNDPLFLAWAYRLDLLSASEKSEDHTNNHWPIAIGLSLVLGFLFVLLAGDQPPVPFADEARSHFRLGWSPIVALAILAFLAITDRSNIQRYGVSGGVILALGALMTFMFWDESEHIFILIALHLPIVIWVGVGSGVVLQYNNPARQFHAFAVKSVEIILTGGIYFGAGMIFLGLTAGIFSVLGIEIDERVMIKAVAWNIGATSLLSLASVYHPSISPIAQNWTSGLTRLLGILTRLMLPLTLGVLVVYIFYFIPTYFWRPFEEREVLIVYNATLMAILVLIALSAAYTDVRTEKQKTLLRNGLRALSSLSTLLNLYALVAICYRINIYGLTPNRYAVLGWNVVTLIMLVMVALAIWRAQSDTWAQMLREALGRTSIFAAIWALWILFVLPLSFD